jgi:Uma2 family endonuclease
MTVTAPSVSPDVQERQRRISVDEYHRMIQAGILGEDEKVQLIDGVLVQMTPQGRPHAFVIQRLNRLLVRALGDDYEVLTQLPLTLSGDSEPEPDLAVVRTQDAQSRTEHPTTAQLVIEVAGESLRFDRRSKAALYARAGIPEYWIVNLADASIEVHRDPDTSSGVYRKALVCRPGETLSAAALPGFHVDVASLFP